MRQMLIGPWEIFLTACCAVVLASSMLMVPVAGWAQQLSGSGLEKLIQGLTESWGPRGVTGPNVRRSSSRQDERFRVQLDAEVKKENLEKQLLKTRVMSADLPVIQRYCRGKISDSDTAILTIRKKFSRLERDFCRRANQILLQIGYDIFQADALFKELGGGVIQDSYVLGIGDELDVNFRGRKSGNVIAAVDHEGRVIIEELPPIHAVGLTFGEFRGVLIGLAKRALIGTEVFVALGAVRSVSVTVAGEVNNPGVYRTNSVSTILDAIALSGGARKTASLRRIQLRRGEQIFWIDLYELLFETGSSHRITLRDGDQVVVPVVGLTVAITGNVRRGGIFELAEGQKSITIGGLLKLAGGVIRPRGNVFSQMTFDKMGRQQIVDRATETAPIRDGDIVDVSYQEDIQIGSVELVGHVRLPGRRALESTPTVSSLVRGFTSFHDDPYFLLAALETTDPATRARQFFPINLQRIIAGQQDFSFRDGDRLIVLGREDIEFLTSGLVQHIIRTSLNPASRPSKIRKKPVARQAVPEILQSGSRPPSELGSDIIASSVDWNSASVGLVRKSLVQESLNQLLISGDLNLDQAKIRLIQEKLSSSSRLACAGIELLERIIQSARPERFATAVQGLKGGGLEKAQILRPCPPLFNTFPGLLPFLLEHVVAVRGEVRAPGLYPVADATPMISIVSVAGGPTRDADLKRVEMLHYAAGEIAAGARTIDLTQQQTAEQVRVEPGDSLRFNAIFSDRDTGPVLLSGEFIRPGLYDIRRGERLSQVIERAGGLTPQAYPYGALFLRERVKRAQRAAMRRAAQDLNSAAIFAAGRKGVAANSLVALRELTQEIASAEPLGRVVIDADPTVLQVRRELDVVLEPGDRLHMPKRPSSILVIGDVLNPGALQFVAGTKVGDYISQAGGFQQSADSDRTFLVYPNGVAQPVAISPWNYNPIMVPPGSTVMVPKDPAPLDIFAFAKDLTSLISQMALTAASLAVISDN